MQKISFTIFFSLLVILSFGGKLGLSISFAQYQTDNQQSYLELYFALRGNTLSFSKNADDLFTGGIEVTATFEQDSTIKAADRFRILSPPLKDTSEISEVFIQQERFMLPPGDYTMLLTVKNINDSTETYKIDQAISIDLGSNDVSSSDLLFLDNYKKASDDNKYSKSGYELIPLVSSGNYYFPKSVNKASFYVEFYNIDKKIGENEDYLIRYYIENADTKKALNKYANFSKKKAANVQPVLAGFDIAELPTGNYNLVVKAVDREGTDIIEEKEFFFRQNEGAALLPSENMVSDASGTFVDRITSFDSLYQYIQYLNPISQQREIDFQKSILERRDMRQMRNYFYTFWSNINPNNPEGEWKKYHKEVKIVNEAYETRLREGYMSSRGSIYLKYGRPYQVEDRTIEPSLPPYEIWQYDQINSPFATKQTNKIFIFAEFESSTNEYELIHSTAIGELYNRRWQYDLSQGVYGQGGDIDQNNINSGNDFGSRINNNIIMGTGGNSRNMR